MNLKRHGRFYIALLAGAAAFAALHDISPGAFGIVLVGNVFFATYLLLTGLFLAEATADHLRRKAAAADEGLPLIMLVTGGAALLSLGAILVLLRGGADASLAISAFALAGIPLGWLTVHTIAAFHYANLYYAPTETDEPARGLDFPDTEEPGPWDFLYFSFVIGMTAQVSDVSVHDTRLRRAVLLHGIVSFFYYTVIVALAVNAAAG